MRLIFPIALLALLASGCASRRNVDLLEAQLREQEGQLRSLQAQVQQAHSELTAARRLNESLKQQAVRQASHGDLLELDEQHFRIAGLKINSLLTGGFDRDGQPGDDQVTLVFAPIDGRDQPIQVPGHVDCELLELAQTARPKRVALWSFDAKKTDAAWQKTFGKPSYRFELPWQTPPTTSDLEVRVRFITQHGDLFDTTSPIKIVPPKSTLGAD